METAKERIHIPIRFPHQDGMCENNSMLPPISAKRTVDDIPEGHSLQVRVG